MFEAMAQILERRWTEKPKYRLQLFYPHSTKKQITDNVASRADKDIEQGLASACLRCRRTNRMSRHAWARLNTRQGRRYRQDRTAS